jgi:hypothetical protein
VRALDSAGNCGAPLTFDLWVDATADVITSLVALTEMAGDPIADGVFQSDADPFMEWTIGAGTSPPMGSSWAVDASADCEVDTPATSLQLATLGDGQHTFQVRGLDSAANCGPTQAFDLWVDATGDVVTSITAFTESGGDPIDEGVFQSDADPFMEWTIGAGTSPPVGSSWAVDSSPDCGVDTTATSVQLATLGDGQHEFQVRALDSANNCGPIEVFDIAIQAVSQPVPTLGPWGLGVLAAVLVFSLAFVGRRGRRQG